MIPCDDPVPATGAFVVDDDGRRWTFSGGLTFDNAAQVLHDAARLPLPKSGEVDLAALAVGDSAALAVLMALKRRARAEHKALAFAGLPATLSSLARVYGVDDLIGG